MTKVVLSSTNVASFPKGGGHWWVFAQWILGLKKCGCDVWWMEHVDRPAGELVDAFATFEERLQLIGLEGRSILFATADATSSRGSDDNRVTCVTHSTSDLERIASSADLLLNFNYHIAPSLLSRFRRTALVDIDPGLLQFWVSTGQLDLPAHDAYFTIGETVGSRSARFSDCGIAWNRIRPAVDVDAWPMRYQPSSRSLTTISGWWGGGGEGEWITDGADVFFENNKRVTFLQFADLPSRVTQSFELALAMGTGDSEGAGNKPRDRWQQNTPEVATEYVDDATDARFLVSRGWHLRSSFDVAGSPEDYRAYIQSSRGEFSCAKPSCMYFQNAWISDRTLCYLASGKPAIVQDTGPSDFLPASEGLFRFSTMEEAVAAVDHMNADYRHHCLAARDLAETHFSASAIAEQTLNRALASP